MTIKGADKIDHAALLDSYKKFYEDGDLSLADLGLIACASAPNDVESALQEQRVTALLHAMAVLDKQVGIMYKNGDVDLTNEAGYTDPECEQYRIVLQLGMTKS